MSTFQLHRALGLELEARFLISSNKKNSKHQPSMTGVLLLKVMKCVEEAPSGRGRSTKKPSEAKPGTEGGGLFVETIQVGNRVPWAFKSKHSGLLFSFPLLLLTIFSDFTRFLCESLQNCAAMSCTHIECDVGRLEEGEWKYFRVFG